MEEVQVKALDEGFRQTKVYEEIKTSEKEIISDLVGLKEGQESLRHDVEVGFDKGRKRMDGMEREMGEIKTLLIQSNTDRDKQHQDLKDEIRNDKMKRIEELLEKKQSWIDKLKYGSLYLIGGTVLTYILWTIQTGGKS